MKIDSIVRRIAEYKQRGLSLFASSSFQSQSTPLLHILSRIDREIPIYFVDTGYLFPETHRFRDLLVDLLGLNVVTLRPTVSKLHQITSDGRLLFASDPDLCCHFNKVEPMEAALARHDVWINGVRADQTKERRAMRIEQAGPYGIRRYHPLLDWTAEDVQVYMRQYGLPRHPLDCQGYVSIGREPCTRRVMDGLARRDGRWFGLNKRECGLHTDLIRAHEAMSGAGDEDADDHGSSPGGQACGS